MTMEKDHPGFYKFYKVDKHYFNLPFKDVYQCLLEGEKLYRYGFLNDEGNTVGWVPYGRPYIRYDVNKKVILYYKEVGIQPSVIRVWMPTQEDLLATDWCIQDPYGTFYDCD